VLVGGAEVGEVGAVGESEVDGGVGARVGKVVALEVGEDQVRQLGVALHAHVDVEDLVVRVAAAVGGVLAAVPQRLEAGEAGAGLGAVAVARALAGLRAHVAGRGWRRVAVGELQLGEPDDVVAVVARDVQAVEAIGRRVVEVVCLGLEAFVEALAGLGVERRPRLRVVRSRERPVLRVAAESVVGRAQRVGDDGDRLGELELCPGRAPEDEPLGLGRAVDEVLLDLAPAGVLAAGGDVHDLVGDVARDAGGPGPGDARRPFGRVDPVGLRIPALE
jgi:hypothetical protein